MLTRSERQDNVVNMYPGTAKVMRRPKANPDGSEIVTRSDYEFPDVRCERHMQNLYQVHNIHLVAQINCAFRYKRKGPPWLMLVHLL